MQQIVARLNEAKKSKGMTLKTLAEASGLSQGTVNKIMSGELQKIKPDKLATLANALGVSVEYLTGKHAAATKSDRYLGLVKIACISPEIKVANCAFNARQIITETRRAAARGVKIALFPELSITGYTCGDLFFQNVLRASAISGLTEICRELADVDAVTVVGLPLCGNDGRLYNVAAVCFRGEVLGIIPKKNLPNYNEFMEKRHFCPYDGENTVVRLAGKDIPFGTKLLFENALHPEVRFGVEVCEDVWVADSPSVSHAFAGANAVLNLSASNETVVKADYRKKMLEIQSAKCGVIYAYCSSGPSESTTSTVFGAHNLICENGECIAESKPFGEGYAEVCADFDFIQNERARLDHGRAPAGYQKINFQLPLNGQTRTYSPAPFVPQDPTARNEVCERTLTILSYGLKKRVEHTRAKKLVIGISGGSDSTLSLLVCQRALRLLRRPASDIVAITMPCFGTSKRTLDNSLALIRSVGAECRVVDISAAVTQHLQDIGHDFTPDVVYENAQARERTQVLMDVANSCDGLVIGTGDMSEAALGWSTFNGDQMSMYAAIASVPKTLVIALLGYCEENAHGELKRVLHDVIDTPISPELLPADQSGNIAQITENVVGPYELHDYFLFMSIRKGFNPSKVYELAKISFAGKYDGATIAKWLHFFLRRFVAQQYKRSCTPDSVRLGSVDLSKYSYRMPSDAESDAWLAEWDDETAPSEKSASNKAQSDLQKSNGATNRSGIIGDTGEN